MGKILTFAITSRLKDSSGWQLVFTSPKVENMIDRLAINAKMGSSQASAGEGVAKMVAIAAGCSVCMWGVTDDGNKTDIGMNEPRATSLHNLCWSMF